MIVCVRLTYVRRYQSNLFSWSNLEVWASGIMFWGHAPNLFIHLPFLLFEMFKQELCVIKYVRRVVLSAWALRWPIAIKVLVQIPLGTHGGSLAIKWLAFLAAFWSIFLIIVKCLAVFLLIIRHYSINFKYYTRIALY